MRYFSHFVVLNRVKAEFVKVLGLKFATELLFILPSSQVMQKIQSIQYRMCAEDVGTGMDLKDTGVRSKTCTILAEPWLYVPAYAFCFVLSLKVAISSTSKHAVLSAGRGGVQQTLAQLNEIFLVQKTSPLVHCYTMFKFFTCPS
jgi:hypothetical protein